MFPLFLISSFPANFAPRKIAFCSIAIPLSQPSSETFIAEPENSSEDFQKLGQVIGITEYLIEVNSLEKTYNYMLEIRDGGILIKPKNLDSFGYIELNKTIVIDKAMGVVLEDIGIPSFQIKTIVIDLLSNIAKN